MRLSFGAIVAAIAGLIVGIPSLRLKGDYLAIVTLGFAEIIRIVILNIDAVGGATRIIRLGYANFLWIGIFAALTVVVVHNIVKSDTGRALISIREDELAAEAMGVNTTRYKVTAFVISSAFAGIAGVLFAHYNKFLSTNDFQFIRSFEDHHYDRPRRNGFDDRRDYRRDCRHDSARTFASTAFIKFRLFKSAGRRRDCWQVFRSILCDW